MFSFVCMINKEYSKNLCTRITYLYIIYWCVWRNNQMYTCLRLLWFCKFFSSLISLVETSCWRFVKDTWPGIVQSEVINRTCVLVFPRYWSKTNHLCNHFSSFDWEKKKWKKQKKESCVQFLIQVLKKETKAIARRVRHLFFLFWLLCLSRQWHKPFMHTNKKKLICYSHWLWIMSWSCCTKQSTHTCFSSFGLFRILYVSAT